MSTEKRLALDVMALVRNKGRAMHSACRRLHADEDLGVYLQTIGPAADGMTDEYDQAWDDFKQYVRSQSHKVGLPEIDAVRSLLPLWRSQGRLLAAVRAATKDAEARPGDDGEGEAAAHSDATDAGIKDNEDGGGTGFGYGAFGA